MFKELKKKTMIFDTIIILLSIILTLITKSAVLSLQIIASISIMSFFYIRYYPVGNEKKERLINKLARFMSIVYIVALLFGGALEILMYK